MRRTKGEYFGVKFQSVQTIAQRVATEPQRPVKKRKRVEMMQYMKLKSESAIVARISIDQNATKLINKKLFQGVTMSTNTPPMIPEK